MITKLIHFSFLGLVFAFSGASGFCQGITFLSNLNELSVGGIAVGLNSQLSSSFTTGDNVLGYRLDSVQLKMGQPNGNPNNFSISIYRPARSEGPGSLLATLSGAPPLTSGIFTYSTTDVLLSPLSRYWLVLRSDTPVANGSFTSNLTSSSNFESGGGWSMRTGYDLSTDGINWSVVANTPLQFAINASVVPEPSSLVLLGVGGSFLFARLARKSRSKALRQP